VPTLHVEDLDVDSSFVPASDAALAGVQNRQNAFQMGSGCLKTSNAQACIGFLHTYICREHQASKAIGIQTTVVPSTPSGRQTRCECASLLAHCSCLPLLR
jgi:hypothetical protein